MKTTVIYHRADFDGIFCREIAKKFLPNAELIGWDYGDKTIPLPREGVVYVLDLSPDCFTDFTSYYHHTRLIWIDHHKTAIDKYEGGLDAIPGYRIDGVAACRLAWQWFTIVDGNTNYGNVGNAVRAAGVLPMIQDFKNRTVNEPMAVRLAGEYDIWDKRDPHAELFQHGLRSRELTDIWWAQLLRTDEVEACFELLQRGQAVQYAQAQNDAFVVEQRSFLVDFQGLRFLALNTARCNSLTFAVRDIPETGHDALMGFYWNGKKWSVSLYHARHRTDLDLSVIAATNGGGGHRGACGFTCETLPFLP